MDKSELRRLKSEQINALSEDYISFSDEAITNKVLSLPEYREAKTVFLYYSVCREVSTLKIAEDALNTGKTVAFPVCSGEGVMRFAQVFDLKSLKAGRFGIPEPPEGAPTLVPDEKTIMIVPCLCADKNNDRLGHGAGYYDRYLSKSKCFTVCLCRKKLLEDIIPVQPSDVRMSFVITE